MSDVKYVYAVARIRVKEKSLLTDMDISQMVGMKDDAAVTAYLADRGWGDQDSADGDAMLRAEERKTVQLMRELKVDESVFHLLAYPNIFHNLKAGIKEICTSESHPEAFYEDYT